MKDDVTKAPLAEAEEAGGATASALPWYLGVAAVLAGYGFFYAAALPELVYDWFNYYGPFSYCAVIPLMALYVVWRERASLRHLPIAPSFIGALVVGAAVFVGLAGKAMGDSFAIRVSMVLALGGLVWLILGRQYFRALLFPIGFLFLMIPWPFVLVKEVAYRLRIVDAVLAEIALRLMGVIVYRDSYFLHLPAITLEVADLCSGISSVFALFALGSYYAYFMPLRPWMKWLTVASTVPFAALINLLRIVLTSALAYYVGPVALGYLVHELTGIITFFIALSLFIGLGELLQRRMPAGARAASEKPAEPQTGEGGFLQTVAARPGGRSWMALASGCAILFSAVSLSARMETSQAMPLTGNLSALPEQIGAYRSGARGWSDPYRDDNAEQELSRYYGAADREPVEMYIGYRSFQSGAKRLKSPKLTMLPDWNFVALESARVPLPGGGAIDGAWMVLQKDTRKQVALYWYQDGAQTFSGEVAHRFHMAQKVIIHKRTEGAVVRIATPLSPSETIAQARERIAGFAASLYPELVKILP